MVAVWLMCFLDPRSHYSAESSAYLHSSEAAVDFRVQLTHTHEKNFVTDQRNSCSLNDSSCYARNTTHFSYYSVVFVYIILLIAD